jgi:neurocalcin delta
MSTADFHDLIVTTKFTPEQIHEWKRNFEIDYPKGLIRKYDFLIMYKKMYPEGDSSSLCDYIFRTYDLDGNGKIDFREFLTTINMTSQGTLRDKLKWTFRMYDVNDDKLVSEGELTEVLMAIYKARRVDNAAYIARVNARELMQDLDKDGDRTLTVDEFVTQAIECPSIRNMLEGRI